MIIKKLYEVTEWQKFLTELENKETYTNKMLINSVKKVIEDDPRKITLDFPLAVRKEIAKYKTDKKRVVYSYPEPYNTYLKMMNWLLQQDEKYRVKFCINSYAYQRGKHIRAAIVSIQKVVKSKKRPYYIKSDFKDYFNSVDVSILKEKMNSFFEPEDQELNELFQRLVSEDRVIVKGETQTLLNKGVMAGTPISGYLANIYMNEVDWQLYRDRVYYVRYADDVFILTDNIERDLEKYKSLVEPLHVKLNEKKTSTGRIEDGFSVLGFYLDKDKVDIDEAKVQKMFSRIRRRSRWFRAWRKKNKIKTEVMVKTFIKGMNVKFYGGGELDDEDRLTWKRWYFKNITSDENLKRIDSYMIQYIRYLISGKHLGYKKHSEVSYEYIKSLGFKSLVGEYWKDKKKKVISDESQDNI